MIHPSAPSHRSSRAVVWGFVLFVLGWFAHAWHDATAHHEICADHGELVEASAAPHCDVASHHQTDEHGAALTATHPNDARHEHCAFVALTQPSLPLDACGFAAVATVTAPVVREPAAAKTADGERLFLLAPKQSPPATGIQRG